MNTANKTNDSSARRVARGQGYLNSWSELLGSMRFAISLLTLICIASAIGTVVSQNQPWVNYVNQFGPFWAEMFNVLGLFQIYNAPWFIAVMAFLVVSTSLCVTRNTPKMIREMRVFRENIRENSLKAFPHRWGGEFSEGVQTLSQNVKGWLEYKGYKVKLDERPSGVMVAAKAGSGNRFGYLATHISIVVICVGGLLDSGVPLKLAVWATGKQPVSGSVISQGIPQESRLGTSNPSYRANLLLPEGKTSKVAVLNTDDGLLVQDLPFELTLDQFRIDFYSTGMPKLFASDVEVFDPDTGERFNATIEVNKPLIYKGVTVYQSSFDDGGTQVSLKGYPLNGTKHYAFDLSGEVGGSTPLSNAGVDYQVEISGFKAINVENLPTSGVEGQQVAADLGAFQDNLANVIGPGVKKDNEREFRNIGPSITYKLRDKAGQAIEFQNYMLPIQLDGGEYFLAGMRETPADSFKYLRIPVDENGGLDGFLRLRASLQDEQARRLAATRFASATFEGRENSDQLIPALADSAKKALDTFAGAGGNESGLQAIANFIERSVPEAERQQATDVIIRILQGGMWELFQISRSQFGLPAALPDERFGRFMQDAQIALSDLDLYGAPVMLQLDQFDEIKASVFQVAKAPGQWVVYLGCLFLVIGVFSMFYIRERRVFFWLTPSASGANLMMGMSTTRKTMDFEKEYEQLTKELSARAITVNGGK